MIAARDPLGAERRFVRGGRVAATLRALVEGVPRLDAAGVAFAWGEGGDPRHSCFQGIARVALAPREMGAAGDLGAALTVAVTRLVEGRVALCLSGGLDSALVLALAVAAGAAPPVYVLAPRVGGDYDEHARASAVARELGCTPLVVDVRERDFVDALPACVRAVEQPLYNLHPVARLLLARRLADDGFDAALTGDGAEELFAAAPDDDYLPLVAALGASCGVALRSPFLDAGVIAARGAPDPAKQALRRVARGRLPDVLIDAPKQARLAPPMEVARHAGQARLAAVAGALGRPLWLDGDRARVQWTTLALLCDQFGVCVASPAS